MSDRFKFRVWLPDIKVMEYLQIFENALKAKVTFIAENSPIMQCTGLKDVRDNLIYESDIILIMSCFGDRKKEVQFIVPNGEFACSWCGDDGRLGFNLSLKNAENAEILGNKYEHPNLLERA